MSCWDVLGVPEGSDRRAIAKAYKALARVRHPDAGGTDKEFRALRDAYDEALSQEAPKTITEAPQQRQSKTSNSEGCAVPHGAPEGLRRGVLRLALSLHTLVSDKWTTPVKLLCWFVVVTLLLLLQAVWAYVVVGYYPLWWVLGFRPSPVLSAWGDLAAIAGITNPWWNRKFW